MPQALLARHLMGQTANSVQTVQFGNNRVRTVRGETEDSQYGPDGQLATYPSQQGPIKEVQRRSMRSNDGQGGPMSVWPVSVSVWPVSVSVWPGTVSVIN